MQIVRSNRGGEYYGRYTENGQAPSLSRPESRSDPIGGSEPVFGTRDSGLGLLT